MKPDIYVTDTGQAYGAENNPEFFGAEAELKADTSVISKGTRAVLIYKAMLAAAPKPEVKP